MTCADARQLIFRVDPAALRDRTDPVLRHHLEGCAECAGAAAHVLADLGRLRAALAARAATQAVAQARSHAVRRRPRRSSRRRAVMTLVPLALAAELAAFAFLSGNDGASQVGGGRVVLDDSVTSLLPAVHTSIDTGDVVPAPSSAPVVVASVPKQADSTTDADSVQVDQVDASATSQLHVRPAARQQFAVIATSNPRITVVWLTKGDTL